MVRKRIHRLQRRYPSVLRQVAVIETKPGTEHRSLAAAGCIGNAKARRKSLAIVVRSPVDPEGLQRRYAGFCVWSRPEAMSNPNVVSQRSP